MMNRRFLAVLGLSAVLALVVSGIFYQITSSTASPRRGKVETKPVVVATQPLPLGVVIKTTDLKVVEWPAQNVPPGTFSKVEEVVERVAVGNILANEPVMDKRVAERGAGVGLSPMIPPGMRAVSVRVNDVISVAGFVLPGSRVDIMVTGIPRGADEGAGPVTRTILTNILVLSAGKKLEPDSKGQPENVPVVTLLLSPGQAELLTLATNEGKIQLSLRNNTDSQLLASAGVPAADIFLARRKPVEPTVSKPRPPPVRAPAPVMLPVASPTPPPPPPPQIEIIRGDKRTVETLGVRPR